MELSVVLDLISTAAIVGGLVFAGLELRASRRQRSHEAQILLLRSFDSPEFTQAMKAVMALPEGISKVEMEARSGHVQDLVWYWSGMMESIGILVFNRDIALRLVDNSFGGPVLITWQKLSRFAAETRAEIQRDTMYEWFQWLAERLAALEHGGGRSPANTREADWTP